MGNDRANLDRNLPIIDRKFPRMSAVTIAPVRDRLLEAIRREFMPLRFGAEMLARAAKKTPRAARNWLSDKNAPDAAALIELMASSENLRNEVLMLVAERQHARGADTCPGSKSGCDAGLFG